MPLPARLGGEYFARNAVRPGAMGLSDIVFAPHKIHTTRTFLLTHKDVTQRLRLVALSRRWQIVILPKRRDSAKMAAARGLASASNTRARFPRFRIVLKKE